MSKQTIIELEAPSGEKDGSYAKYVLDSEHAANLLRMSNERGWGWRLPKDSEWAYNSETGTFYKKPKEAKKPKLEKPIN